ncbi:MAG: GIY-YIG nuclease family protein [Acidobacteria bacterium]|nr:GIY-YIG nuclease family protein [Acidobacteriota bacterium]
MYYVYILKSQRSGRYYVGATEDVARRLRERNGELSNPSRSRPAERPWELVFQAPYGSRSEAMAAERYIKTMKSRDWIAKLLAGEYRLPHLGARIPKLRDRGRAADS